VEGAGEVGGAPEASGRQSADIRMLGSGVVYEDNWMRLRRDEIERRDGTRGTYAFVEKADFALVIPAENDGFHLVEEFRYPIGRRTWSFPQGGFPHGQSGRPEELARLELEDRGHEIVNEYTEALDLISRSESDSLSAQHITRNSLESSCHKSQESLGSDARDAEVLSPLLGVPKIVLCLLVHPALRARPKRD